MRIALVLLFVAACAGSRPAPPSPGVDKRGIQQRADQSHESLKEEEDRAKKRKDE